MTDDVTGANLSENVQFWSHDPADWSMTDVMSRPSPLSPIIASCLQGNCYAACESLRKLSGASLSSQDSKFKAKFLARFEAKTPSVKFRKTGFEDLDSLIQIYHEYWHLVLTRKVTSKAGETLLRKQLSNALGLPKQSKFEAIERRIHSRFSRRGLHVLTGVTRPFRELQVWSSERTAKFAVRLPELKQRVVVVFMQKFLVRGWLAYATLDKKFATGWAKDGKLYCNSDFWKPSSEAFRVSFLTHETQHHTDYRRFPKLTQIDLEYRAKLAELSVSQRTTRKLLTTFRGLGASNRNSPHAYANWMLSKRVSEKMETGIGSSVNDIARSLLIEHSAALKDAGATRTRGIL